MEMQQVQLMLALVRSALGSKSPERKELCTDENLKAIYPVSCAHDIAHLIGQGLYDWGIYDNSSDVVKAFKKQHFQAVYRYEQSQNALEKVRKAFEQAQIPFMPLKGAVIRQHYPQAWMRTSCDLDVLVHPEDLDGAVEALVAENWKVSPRKDYHDISLYSPSGIHLELHFSLREDMPILDKVLDQVWAHATSVTVGAWEYGMSGAFLLFYLLAHMAYHFSGGGCGIRALADIWLLKKQVAYDRQQLDELLKDADLTRFYESVEELIAVWFENAPHTHKTETMQAYIVGGGAYGSITSQVTMSQARTGGKGSRLKKRIFMPYDKLKIKYPVLEKYKLLFPVFQVVRWCSVFDLRRLARVKRELQIHRDTTSEQVQRGQDILRLVGLDFQLGG